MRSSPSFTPSFSHKLLRGTRHLVRAMHTDQLASHGLCALDQGVGIVPNGGFDFVGVVKNIVPGIRHIQVSDRIRIHAQHFTAATDLLARD